MEKYELANGAVYEIVRKLNITPKGWVDCELWYIRPEDKAKQVPKYFVGAADYSTCRKYIEGEAIKVKAGFKK